MPESCPSLHLLTSYNPYPDCIFLKLESSPLTVQTTIMDPVVLHLTLRFQEQEKSLLNGHLKFGLKGGQLTCTISNGEIIEPQQSINNRGQLTKASSLSCVWQFSSQDRVSILKTTKNISSPLLSIQPTTSPLSLTLTYDVSPSELSIFEVEGLWRHDIHPNKHGILERTLAQFLWKLRLSPHLCRQEFTSDALASATVSEDNPENKMASHALSHLHQRLDDIYRENTNNLLELAKIAQLNPLVDLAGGNFLAAELSGIQLSGVNLTRSNFRGANLTDTDLSEATLSYAKFNGADLSGAYLSNANLRQADFYRASLALANLIGADLTEANLQEVNLSQANLSGATVIGTKFGDNPGINEEMKASLMQRGAIFVGNS